MKKITAFTLSEVLITVGIIGVVSALTVPTLMRNYQNQAQTVQLRKVVSEIENAIDMFITEEGKTSLASTSIAQDGGVDSFIRTHFKTVKSCSDSETSNCFANEQYMSIDGNESRTFRCSNNSYILANSAVICANRVSQVTANGINIELFIDTNGAQAPNIGGRDMFHVYIQPDGRIYDQAVEEQSKDCGEDAFGSGCFARLLENNWRMNY